MDKNKDLPENGLQTYQDPEIEGLKTELRDYEETLTELSNEKIEIEKQLIEFELRHSSELGDIILELLSLRKLKFRNDKTKFEEADNDERQYKEKVKRDRNRTVRSLTQEQKAELKRKFREATQLCHPDKVSDENKGMAEAMFIELKNSYELNDLERVTEILNELKKGGFVLRSETVTEKDYLKASISQLKLKIQSLRTQITEIKESETYKTVISIEDWDGYFSRVKLELLNELENLRRKV